MSESACPLPSRAAAVEAVGAATIELLSAFSLAPPRSGTLAEWHHKVAANVSRSLRPAADKWVKTRNVSSGSVDTPEWLATDAAVRIFHLTRSSDGSGSAGAGRDMATLSLTVNSVAMELSRYVRDSLCALGAEAVVEVEAKMMYIAIAREQASVKDKDPVYPERCFACQFPKSGASATLVHKSQGCVVARCEAGHVLRWHDPTCFPAVLDSFVAACKRSESESSDSLLGGGCFSEACDAQLRSVQQVLPGGKASTHELFFRIVDEEDAKPADVSSAFPGARVIDTVLPRTETSSSVGGAGGPLTSARGAAGAVLPEPEGAGAASLCWMKLPSDARLVVLLGPSGSGKSTALRSLAMSLVGAEAANEAFDEVDWDPEHAIVSQIVGPGGDPEEARRWLGCVGLNSVPAWCSPAHCLSTGQRYRANVARRLSAAARGCGLLVLDDFTSRLDRVSAACTANSLGKELRRTRRLRALVASCNADVVQWLQPDVVVLLRRFNDGGPHIAHQVLINKHAGRPPHVSVDARGAEMFEEGHGRVVSELPASLLELRGITVSSSTSFDHTPPFEFDHARESAQTGGVVLRSRVVTDSATKMCDKLFDTAFGGESFFRVPDFPRPSELGPFSLGVICGPSGSAKSVLLRSHFGCEATVVSWRDGCPLSEHFEAESAAERLAAVGLDPTAYSNAMFPSLSRGEKAQATLARLLGRSNVVIDEFTSDVDRGTAATMARALSKFSKRHQASGVVVASCHSDIIAGGCLEPNWVYDTQSCTLLQTRVDEIDHELPMPSDKTEMGQALTCTPGQLWQLCVRLTKGEHADRVISIAIPTVRSRLRRCDPSMWQKFREHHYKTRTLSSASRAFLLTAQLPGLPEQSAGFMATIPHTGGRERGSMKTLPYRAHRTVILPEWQGIGIGSRLSDAVAEIHRREGRRYFGQTVHPRFGEYRDRSPLWVPTEWNHTESRFKIESWRQRLDGVRVRLKTPRFVYSHEYVGPRDASGAAYLSSRVRLLAESERISRSESADGPRDSAAASASP